MAAMPYSAFPIENENHSQPAFLITVHAVFQINSEPDGRNATTIFQVDTEIDTHYQSNSVTILPASDPSPLAFFVE
ncbi:MAG: hypothetical protein KKE73_05775 [Proteobacteria bacterium]|nr:hypothetical protein [Pseudomonadota bacterium]